MQMAAKTEGKKFWHQNFFSQSYNDNVFLSYWGLYIAAGQKVPLPPRTGFRDQHSKTMCVNNKMLTEHLIISTSPVNLTSDDIVELSLALVLWDLNFHTYFVNF